MVFQLAAQPAAFFVEQAGVCCPVGDPSAARYMPEPGTWGLSCFSALRAASWFILFQCPEIVTCLFLFRFL